MEQVIHNTFAGTVALMQALLGSFPKPHYDKAYESKRRQLVQDELRAQVEYVGWHVQTRRRDAEPCEIN